MEHAAPALLQALEHSALGAAIRQAVWIYPLANVAHVLAVVVMAGAVAVMDARLLGAFREAPAAALIRRTRWVAVAAFLAIGVSGAMLFIAEASHLALNPVFQVKMLLVALALGNVVLFEARFGRRLAAIPAGAPMPGGVRLSAAASLGLWLAVVACGRSIAYA